MKQTKSRLLGCIMRVRTGVAIISGLRVKVLRHSSIGTLTVELIEGRQAYKVGDRLHVMPYELEPIQPQLF